MAWAPISEADVLDLINVAYRKMSPAQRAFWESVAIHPEKWAQHPYGDEGGGFWVAAVIGRTIIWYNDIEEGWNTSEYSRYGEFADYWCNEDDLYSVAEGLLTFLRVVSPLSSGQIGSYCCEGMRRGLEFQTVVSATRSGFFGLPIYDGGSSCLEISFCPWCGTKKADAPA
ncbi:MAG TPA: hypothetical protein VIM69_03590 [Opitutaceae bacterium]